MNDAVDDRRVDDRRGGIPVGVARLRSAGGTGENERQQTGHTDSHGRAPLLEAYLRRPRRAKTLESMPFGNPIVTDRPDTGGSANRSTPRETAAPGFVYHRLSL